jgi:hypothetical protein
LEERRARPFEQRQCDDGQHDLPRARQCRAMAQAQRAHLPAIADAAARARDGVLDHAGKVAAGTSAIITRAFLEDEITFQFTVNGVLVKRAFPVNFQFVMDE